MHCSCHKSAVAAYFRILIGACSRRPGRYPATLAPRQQSESRRPKSLDAWAVARVATLRDAHGVAFPDIAAKVRNASGENPTPRTCANAYWALKAPGDFAAGLFPARWRPVKLTLAIAKRIVRRLVVLRRRGPCAATTVRADLARTKGVSLDVSKAWQGRASATLASGAAFRCLVAAAPQCDHAVDTAGRRRDAGPGARRRPAVSGSQVRRVLRETGCKRLPRVKRRVCTADEREERRAFAQSIVDLTPAQFRARIHMSMDGVVLALPPREPKGRMAYLRQGKEMVWRKPEEPALSETAGSGNKYDGQVPLSRALPMWGGISGGGAAPVIFHAKKKIKKGGWAQAVPGHLFTALLAIDPGRRRGPFRILCDSETFLTSSVCQGARDAKSIRLMHVPARSPDLNPVEVHWSWLRRRLRALDLKGAQCKREVPGALAYQQRVRAVMKSAKSRAVAGNIMRGPQKKCAKIAAL
ncbi:unnamed protein product, partial [Prorocentrum cordatum]